ncbi:MAG: glycosyltransferase family 39 protein [Candidatus Omnitrophica bacterium]|nr:glycosyltransferase family 39 protein [Candidatus Omnitrophota bacterium]
MRKYLKRLPLIIILILSLAVRLALIAKGAFNIDSLQMALLAEKVLATGQLQFQYGTGYPLTILLGSLFIYLGKLIQISDPVISFNFMSVFFSTLSVFVFYMLTDYLFNRRAAIFAASLFTINPIFLDISLFGMSHAPCIFFILLAVYYYLLAGENGEEKKIYLSAFFLGLAGAVRFQEMGMIIIALIFHSLYTATQKNQNVKFSQLIKRLSAYCTITFFTTLCFHLPYFLTDIRHEYIAQLGHYSQLSFSLWPNLATLTSLTDKLSFIFYNFHNHTIYYIIEGLTPMGVFASLAGCLLAWRAKQNLCVLLLFWIMIPLAIYGLQMTSSARFLTFIMPPFYILLGYLFAQTLSFSPLSRLISLTIFLSIFFLSITQNFPFFISRHHQDTIKEYALWVKKKTEPNAYIINSDEGLFVQHYGERKHLSRPLGYTFIKEDDLKNFKMKLDRMLNERTPVYITSNALHVYDPRKQFAALIKGHYQLKLAGSQYCEYWHRSPFEQLLFYVNLYRIQP